MKPEHEFNALVAREIFGIKKVYFEDWDTSQDYPQVIPSNKPWRTHKADAVPLADYTHSAGWTVVQEVQRKHPGWRFSLLGGDVSMGYRADARGEWLRDAEHNLIVDEESRESFGWHARFFGDLDPRVDHGETHGEARAETPGKAICLAALATVGAEVPVCST